MNRTTKRTIIELLIRAGRPRLANAVAKLVIAKMSVQEALDVLDFDPQRLGDAAALKQAYRAKSMEHHPDRGGSTQMMQQVNEAYEVLVRQKGPGSRGETPSEKIEKELKRNQAAAIVEQGLRQSFDEQKFTQHIEKFTGKKFTVTSKLETKRSHYSDYIFIEAKWVSQDGKTTFDLSVWSDTSNFQWGPRKLGTGGQDFSFSVSAQTAIFHETRKVKFRQNDWNLTSDSRLIFNPETLFPKKKIAQMMTGKERKRKFSKRDMLLGLEKLVGAKVWRSGKDDIADIPLGKDGGFTLQLRRITMMGQAMWVVSRTLWKGKIGYKGSERFDLKGAKDIPEREAALVSLEQMRRKSSNLDDPRALGKLVADTTQKIWADWAASEK
jgi:hypothetical protein